MFKLVSGHLTEKNGYWYIILHVMKENGKKGPKWFSTGLKVKGNKKKAEALLIDMRRQYTMLGLSGDVNFRSSFSEYMAIWLDSMKSKVAPSTFKSYRNIVINTIIPYFNEHPVKLCAVKPAHLDALYQMLLERQLSPNTVIRHHAVLHKALGDAVRKELIAVNPAELAQRPRKADFITVPYVAEEINELFETVKGHKLELIIKLTAFYGLRRSEVLGLKWKAIDFRNGTIAINHTFQRVPCDGTTVNVARDQMKRKSSCRTLPLPGNIQKTIIDYRNERCANELPSSETYLFTDGGLSSEVQHCVK